MWYRKNLYAWEQMLRVIVGGGAAVAAFLLGFGFVTTLIIVGSGVGLALTGVFGYCPACALVGRKIDEKG
jgi:hypothetical protein